MLLAGAITIATLMILLLKLPRSLLLKLLGLDVATDIGVTFGLSMLFAGTYSGLMTAVFAGLIFSVVLAGVKKLIGYELPHITDTYTIAWTFHPGVWR